MSPSPNPEPGAESDLKGRHYWYALVRNKHRLQRFTPPLAACKCKSWSVSAPGDMGVLAQRDWLLDRFNEHLKKMRFEKRLLREKAIAEAAAAKAKP